MLERSSSLEKEADLKFTLEREQVSTIAFLKTLLYLVNNITAIAVVNLSNWHIHLERIGWMQRNIITTSTVK